jgi:hypothetical protein
MSWTPLVSESHPQTPWSHSLANEEEYHDSEDVIDEPASGSLESESVSAMQSTRSPSPIPAVHREESHSRLHEIFSEDGDSLSFPDRQRIGNDYTETISSTDGDGRPPIPISVSTASPPRSTHGADIHYFANEAPTLRNSHNGRSWGPISRYGMERDYQPYAPPNHELLGRRYSPTFVQAHYPGGTSEVSVFRIEFTERSF